MGLSFIVELGQDGWGYEPADAAIIYSAASAAAVTFTHICVGSKIHRPELI